MYASSNKLLSTFSLLAASVSTFDERMAASFASKLNDEAARMIGEPVAGSVVVSLRGRQGAAFFGPPGLALHSAMKERTAFATTNVLAVTEDALYAFTAGGALSPKIREPIGAWAWPDITVLVSDGALVRFLSLSWNDGATIQLEARVKGANRFQIAVLDEIVGRCS